MQSERIPASEVRKGFAVQSPHTGQLYLVVDVTDEDGKVVLHFGKRGKDPSLGLIRAPSDMVTVRRPRSRPDPKQEKKDGHHHREPV